MTLSIEQQARAVKVYIKEQLTASPEGSEILKDCDFLGRLDANFITLFSLFSDLYGHRDDCLDQLVELVALAGRSWRDRLQDLKILDRQREFDPEWFMSQTMLGGACYVDHYADDLSGIRTRIPYFKELGLTYLHLLPLFDTPEPLCDGGYAVSDYRKVKPRLGTIEDLRVLATELREAGISLVLDMVFNHTSNEHEWARKAAARDPEFEGYYWIFPDRNLPDAFEKTTREVFP
jgi:amylosucrase